MEQRSDEWFSARAGKATASNFRRILAKIKSGEAADRRNYRAQLVVERLTGKADEGYENAAMRWGTEQEPFARIAYIAATGANVEEVGFIQHPQLMAGCSPDGLIGEEGGLEIKCPTKATHLDTLKAQAMPAEHMPQVQGCMWITGRKWWDFVSYHPEFPEHLQLFIVRIERDEQYIAGLEKEVRAFLKSVDDEMEAVSRLAA
jgi:YqaJ-like viral recombinase domain.